MTEEVGLTYFGNTHENDGEVSTGEESTGEDVPVPCPTLDVAEGDYIESFVIEYSSDRIDMLSFRTSNGDFKSFGTSTSYSS